MTLTVEPRNPNTSGPQANVPSTVIKNLAITLGNAVLDGDAPSYTGATYTIRPLKCRVAGAYITTTAESRTIANDTEYAQIHLLRDSASEVNGAEWVFGASPQTTQDYLTVCVATRTGSNVSGVVFANAVGTWFNGPTYGAVERLVFRIGEKDAAIPTTTGAYSIKFPYGVTLIPDVGMSVSASPSKNVSITLLKNGTAIFTGQTWTLKSTHTHVRLTGGTAVQFAAGDTLSVNYSAGTGGDDTAARNLFVFLDTYRSVQ